jgi:S-adenosylmethionine decarboxylase
MLSAADALKPATLEGLTSSIPKTEQLAGPVPVPAEQSKDHFVTRNGVTFAGSHLIIDLWGAKHLDDIERMENAMRRCVEVCGATLLHIHVHHFAPDGVSGVAVLAESHISVHTWPEREYAAFDVFMCGDAMPELAIVELKRAFFPERIEVSEHLRGVIRER